MSVQPKDTTDAKEFGSKTMTPEGTRSFKRRMVKIITDYIGHSHLGAAL
jgi:hypothetical protein